MALKSDRHEARTDISYYYNQGVAERGGVVVYGATEGSGAAMDQGEALVLYKAATSSDKVAGLLLNDVVNKDLTRDHINIYKDEVQLGGKVTLLLAGYVVTDLIDSDATPSAGAIAYASTTTAGNVTTSGIPQHAAGRFRGAKDADGYAKLEVNLPTTVDTVS